jgi:uncharacterized protein YeaO (DUF488 family)
MPIRTRRWDDPVEEGDGFRLLVTRYRPRGIPKADETWDAWQPDLGPSRTLHAAAYGKHGITEIPWETYRVSYLREMRGVEQVKLIEALAKRAAGGETITLLCSSACVREARCHRSLLKDLIERQAERIKASNETAA